MRMRLVGYSGARPPVPGTVPVEPEDPGPTPDPVPDDIPSPLLLVLADGTEFRKADYLALGYNRFDVMCIGGAGGRAGVIKQTVPTNATHKQVVESAADVQSIFFNAYRYAFGGAGGGGGVHRVKGRLALLPTVVPVEVGQAGADGAYSEITEPFWDFWWTTIYPPPGTPNPAPPLFPVRAIPPGVDGEASSFGGVICRASGGKGGAGLSGGAGGIGNADGAGGGLASPWTPSTGGTGGGAASPAHMNTGVWDGKIGTGGAGGRGSTLRTEGSYPIGGAQMGVDPKGGHSGYSSEADGAAGAYSSVDPSVSGPGELGLGLGINYDRVAIEMTQPTDGSNPAATGYNYIAHEHFDHPVVIPGPGGGATAFPLTGDLVTHYGSKAGGRPGTGAVIVRLTYAIV